MRLSPKTIHHAIDLLSAILGTAARDELLDIKVNPADDRRLRVRIPKKDTRDFLEANEVLSLLVAGELFDNPVKPATVKAAAEVRRLRDLRAGAAAQAARARRRRAVRRGRGLRRRLTWRVSRKPPGARSSPAA